jgi:ADP-heptose:LPS heptosyltransferase
LSDELLALVSEASRGKIINWTGQTSLLETLALLQHMDVLVGADSGPLHMAAAVGTPVIALFGPMSPVKWHPLTEHVTIITENLPCRPCHLKPTCGTSYHCMTQITAERVTQACLTQLKRWRRKTRFGTSRRASSL